MGLHNRTYWQGGSSGGYGGGGGMRMGLPKPEKGVAGLLIANLVVFVLEHLMPSGFLYALTLIPDRWFELWRFITFQFLHADVLHILFNMIGLYFLGMYLEKAWGTRRFLTFYLISGAFAGFCHVVLMYAMGGGYFGTPLLGASGGVYAVIMACAILFPGIQLIVMFFPMPIRVAAALFFVISGLMLLSGGGGGISHAAHFGGMIFALGWLVIVPRLREHSAETRQKLNEGAWQKKQQQQQQQNEQIDRILAKIRNEGIGSLSSREKKILQDATERQRREDRNASRM